MSIGPRKMKEKQPNDHKERPIAGNTYTTDQLNEMICQLSMPTLGIRHQTSQYTMTAVYRN